MNEIISPSNQDRIEDIINTFVFSGGTMELVQERFALTKWEIFSILAQNADILQHAIKVATLVSVYQLEASAYIHLKENLGEQKPYDLSKTYVNMAQTVHHMTANAPPVMNINVEQGILKMVPPEIREALLAITAGQANGD